MTNYILYLVTILLLLLSTGKDRRKTKMALRKAWKAFANILPEFSGVKDHRYGPPSIVITTYSTAGRYFLPKTPKSQRPEQSGLE